MADYSGQHIGNYHLLTELSSGAFGSVYLAQHSILTERRVAVKLLHTYLPSQQEREQFLQEARFLEQLSHPHILPLVDVGISDNLPYLVTAYAPGGSLRNRLKQQAPHLLPQEQALTILTHIGQALHYAHQKNIVHRDLKPENILFTAQGEALLADFGVATMLATVSMQYMTVAWGSPPYMAPEQFQGNVSKESDQYALGCIAYELFTGQLPFSAPDPVSMGFKHTSTEPVAPTQFNPHLPASIERAILTAMAKRRSDRYPDVASFITALSSAPTIYSIAPPATSREEGAPTTSSARSQLRPSSQREVAAQPAFLPSGAPGPVSSLPPTVPITILPSARTETNPVSPGERPPTVPQPSQERDGKGRIWRIGKRHIVAALLGTALYGILSLSQFSPVLPGGIGLYPAFLILLFFGGEFGPLVGLFIGVVGTATHPALSGNIALTTSWPEYLGAALIGFIAGLALLQARGGYNTIRTLVIAEAISAVGIIVGVSVDYFFQFWFLNAQVPLLSAFVTYLLANVIFCLVLLPILLLIYNAIAKGRRAAALSARSLGSHR